MVSTRPKGKYTYGDYFATPEGERWELIDGVLYHMAAAPNRKHQTASGNMFFLFSSQIRPGRLGLVYAAPFAVMLPDESTVEPDLLFVSAARRDIVTERACEGPPDLVVEILSPSNTRHDLERKRELYARHGIPMYLIVDADAESVRALTEPIVDGIDGVYTQEVEYHAGDIMDISVIPGLWLAVSDIFESPL